MMIIIHIVVSNVLYIVFGVVYCVRHTDIF